MRQKSPRQFVPEGRSEVLAGVWPMARWPFENQPRPAGLREKLRKRQSRTGRIPASYRERRPTAQFAFHAWTGPKCTTSHEGHTPHGRCGACVTSYVRGLEYRDRSSGNCTRKSASGIVRGRGPKSGIRTPMAWLCEVRHHDDGPTRGMRGDETHVEDSPTLSTRRTTTY